MYYDSYAQAQPTGIGNSLNRKVNTILARLLTTPSCTAGTVKIGEVGYGRGLFARAFRSLQTGKKIEYYAIEPNHAMAQQARDQCTAVSEFPLPPFPRGNGWSGFDYIVLSHVVEHFPHYNTILEVLGQISDALKEDGRLMVFFPDYLDYREDFFSVDHSHEYILTRRRMLMLLEDAGFVPVVQKSFRGSLTFPLAALVYPLHRLVRFIAGILWSITGKDIYFKLRITLARNICIIARKR